MSVANSMSPTQSPTPGAPRVAVHAFPSPTTTRFVVILAAMLASGLFVGDWLHGLLRGEQYVQIIERCLEQAGYTPSLDTAREQLAVHDTAASCYASAQYNRAAYSLVSAILVMLAGVSVLFLAPPIISGGGACNRSAPSWRRPLAVSPSSRSVPDFAIPPQ